MVKYSLEGVEKPGTVSRKRVCDWKKTPSPKNVMLVTEDEELNQDINSAKERELKIMTENHILENLPNYGKPTTSFKWVLI